MSSQVLQKYRDELKKAEGIIEAWRGALVAALTHMLALVKGSGELDRKISNLIERTKVARDAFQIRNIQKEYVLLRADVDAALAVADEGGGGGLFAGLGGLFRKGQKEVADDESKGGVRPGHYPLVEPDTASVIPYATLLEGFSKGTLLLAEEREPFFKPLSEKRREKFKGLGEEEAAALARQIFTFLFHKSNESQIVDREREELKQVIGSLTGYIEALAVTSDDFHDKMNHHSARVAAATSLDEIKQVQRAIMGETLEIQKANASVRARLTETERQVKAAAERIAKLERELEMARQEKSVDALTGVYNRGYFDERLAEGLEKFKRDARPVCLILFDIDHFKKFNDTYGHQVGDQVLKVVAEVAKETVRASDTVCRYGGEEFALILYDTDAAAGMKVAESVRKNICAHEFGLKGKTIQVTVSLGVAPVTRDDTSATVIGRADKALYRAKDQGRNRAEPA